MEDRETPLVHKYGESKTTRIMMATVRHVTSSSGLRKFQADGFFFDWVYIGLLQALGLYHRICALTVRCSVNYCDYKLQLIHCVGGKKLNTVTGNRDVLQNVPVLSHKLYERIASSNSPCRMWMISLTLTDCRKHVANDTVYSNWKFATSCSARMRVIVNYRCGCHIISKWQHYLNRRTMASKE